MKRERGYGESGHINLEIKDAPVSVTDHAMDQFMQRWKPLDEFDVRPDNESEWHEKFMTLIRDSKEVTLQKIVRIKRAIDSDFQNSHVRYFLNQTHNLRFVAAEEGSTFHVITVETPLPRSENSKL